MKKTNEGIVLITVLLFMQLFTILGLFALQNGFLAKLSSYAFYQQDKHRRQIEQILIQVEINWIPACLIPAISRDELLIKPLDWWKSREMCTGQKNQLQYYYAIENLGEDPCAYRGDQISKSAYYFRVTVLTFLEHQKTKELLQSTIIKMDNAVRKCEGQPHPIIPGRQSWRKL